MRTPTTPRGRAAYDHLPPLDALVDEDPIALRDAAWRLATALTAAEHRADEAEARIKAVRDELALWDAAPAGQVMPVNGAAYLMRRALDGEQ